MIETGGDLNKICIFMKRILIFVCLLLLVSCSSKKTVIEDRVLEHKWTDYETLEEVNELTHGHLANPGIYGVSQERYSTMEFDDGLVGQYFFMVDKYAFTYRFSDTILDHDISDIEIDNKPAFDNNKDNVNVIGTKYRLIRWFNTDGQYVLIGPIEFKEEEFTKIANNLKESSSN